MAGSITPPRGMRDILPAEKARRERILGLIRGAYRARGFDEIETPVAEDWELLTSGLGGDNEKLTYPILRRGLTADDVAAASGPDDLVDLGLRFDLTVPLARFHASHRGELPAVLRAIQIGPVWRAERPQKGRYRQFVQCDIDILGEAGPIAEVELIVATLAALDALGLEGAEIRINDRRLLIGMLDGFGVPEAQRTEVLVTLDKLDKLGPDGVVAELRERRIAAASVDALQAFLHRPVTLEWSPFGERAIRKLLPPDPDADVVARLAGIGEAVRAARGGERDPLVFDPFLVRGMGYYTGAIFEVAHPSVPYSLGGGGRYDGMIGRFSGVEVPAAGFSLGFERLVELVDPPGETEGGVALVYDADLDPAMLVGLQESVIRTGARVRLMRRTKNVTGLLDQAKADGFTRFAFVDATTTSDTLGLRPLD